MEEVGQSLLASEKVELWLPRRVAKLLKSLGYGQVDLEHCLLENQRFGWIWF